MTGTNRVDTVFVFGLLAVVSGAFFGLILPQIKQRRASAAEARKLEDTLSTSYQVSMDLKQIEDEITRIRGRLQDFDTRLPSATEIDKFLAQLSSIAARCDVELDLVKPGSIEVRSLHAELPVSLEANCRFTSLPVSVRAARNAAAHEAGHAAGNHQGGLPEVQSRVDPTHLPVSHWSVSIMAVNQTSSRGPQVSEQQKMFAMLALIAVLAGIWGYRLMKRRGSSKSVPAKVEDKSVEARGEAAVQKMREVISKVVATTESDQNSAETELPKAVVLKALPMFSRDPFAVSDAMAKLMIKPEPVKEEGQDTEQGQAGDATAEEEAGPALKLEGTVIDGATRYALIDGEVVVVGQTLHDMKVTEIHEREVVLEAPAGTLRLAIE